MSCGFGRGVPCNLPRPPRDVSNEHRGLVATPRYLFIESYRSVRIGKAYRYLTVLGGG